MEEAYRELNEGRAGYRPRIDFYVPEEPHYYRWGTMEGASRKLGVFAIRMKSDMLAWEEQDGFKVEDKYCMQRGTYCGLIFLLSTRNAEPLALMNDGFLQHMRVGACAGLGTKYLSQKNSKVLAMIGSGGMARTYAMAIKEVRPIKTIVSSPHENKPKAYAQEMTEQLDIEVVPADSPEKALKGADIVSLTTDSLVPVIKAEWLEPGMTSITCAIRNRRGRVESRGVRTRLGTSTLFADRSVSGVALATTGCSPISRGAPKKRSRSPLRRITTSTIPNRHGARYLAGRWVGRANDQQVTFLDNQGTQGLQFAAVGGRPTIWQAKDSAIHCQGVDHAKYARLKSRSDGVLEYWSEGYIKPNTPTLHHSNLQGGFNYGRPSLVAFLAEDPSALAISIIDS